LFSYRVTGEFKDAGKATTAPSAKAAKQSRKEAYKMPFQHAAEDGENSFGLWLHKKDMFLLIWCICIIQRKWDFTIVSGDGLLELRQYLIELDLKPQDFTDSCCKWSWKLNLLRCAQDIGGVVYSSKINVNQLPHQVLIYEHLSGLYQ
jgi:hypothetical protein